MIGNATNIFAQNRYCFYTIEGDCLMKKLINLLILFTTILSLTFINAIPINAAAKVNITYYANNGYFKAKPNRSKSKITIKNKTNKKRGYAPAIRRDGYTFDGWYTKKKVARSIQLLPLLQRNKSYILIGLKNTKLILNTLFLWD